jgi:hypothetical protein
VILVLLRGKDRTKQRKMLSELLIPAVATTDVAACARLGNEGLRPRGVMQRSLCRRTLSWRPVEWTSTSSSFPRMHLRNLSAAKLVASFRTGCCVQQDVVGIASAPPDSSLIARKTNSSRQSSCKLSRLRDHLEPDTA